MNENRQKLSLRVKRYLKNLMKALFGLDPYREELEEAKQQLEKSAENLSAMQDQYYKALDNWGETQKALEESDATNKKLLQRIGTIEKRAASSQVLVENLRERIKEKDAEMEAAGEVFRERTEHMKQDYQKRIDDYNQLIDYVRSNKNVPYEIGVIIDRLMERR